jgi:hypothetical protein
MKYSIVKQDVDTNEVFSWTPVGWQEVKDMNDMAEKLWFFPDMSIVQILAMTLAQDSRGESSYVYIITPETDDNKKVGTVESGPSIESVSR